jgi:DNA-binding MarR family transcriptional regulator
MNRLQQELKQNRPFPSLHAEALVSIVRTAAVLDHALNDILKPYGLTNTQYNVLRILRGAGDQGLCGKEIASRLVSPAPDVARLLDRMEETGLIVRERDAKDRRYVTTRIAPRGMKLLAEVDPVLEMTQLERFRKLSTATLESLIEALEALR